MNLCNVHIHPHSHPPVEKVLVISGVVGVECRMPRNVDIIDVNGVGVDAVLW